MKPLTDRQREQLRALHEAKRNREPTERERAHLLRLNGPRLGRDRLWWSCWLLLWRAVGLAVNLDRDLRTST